MGTQGMSHEGTRMSEGDKAATGAGSERAFQLDILRLQMSHGYRVGFYAAYFGVGASFEVFSLTLLLTAILLGKGIEIYWWVLIAIYLGTGFGFVAYGVRGFGQTRRLQDTELRRLTERYA